MALQRLRLGVPASLADALRARALEEGVSLAEMGRRALELGLRREALEGEDPAAEAMRLLAEQARAGKTQAVVQYARMAAAGPPAGSSSGDPDDELAARRRRA